MSLPWGLTDSSLNANTKTAVYWIYQSACIVSEEIETESYSIFFHFSQVIIDLCSGFCLCDSDKKICHVLRYYFHRWSVLLLLIFILSNWQSLLSSLQVLSGCAIIVRGQPRGGPPPERQINLSNIRAGAMARRAAQGQPDTKDTPDEVRRAALSHCVCLFTFVCVWQRQNKVLPSIPPAHTLIFLFGHMMLICASLFLLWGDYLTDSFAFLISSELL